MNASVFASGLLMGALIGAYLTARLSALRAHHRRDARAAVEQARRDALRREVDPVLLAIKEATQAEHARLRVMRTGRAA